MAEACNTGCCGGGDTTMTDKCAAKFPLTEQEKSEGFVCLTEDGGIKKKILTEAANPQGQGPPPNSQVTCHYTGTLPDQNDEKFDSSRDRNDPFKFKIGNGQVIKGWDVGIASMGKGERCILRCASPYAYGPNGSPPKIPGGATLDFDVELIDWDDWDECSGSDGKIRKRIITPSDGGYDDDVSGDAKLTITYRAYYLDGEGDEAKEMALCSREGMAMTADDDDRFTEGFHTALKSMKRGEKALFRVKDASCISTENVFVSAEEAKNNEGDNNKVSAPEGKDTFYEIEVTAMEKGKEKWNASEQERVDEGFRYKTEGNAMFKELRYAAAIKKYTKALDWVDKDFEDDEELKKKKLELDISANNNLALIYLKRKDYAEATEHATKVLDIEPNNLKALLRRGQSRLYGGFLEESKADLKRAQGLDATNTAVAKLLKVVTVKHKAYVKKQQKLYAGMFGGGGKGKGKKKRKVEKVEKAEKAAEETKKTAVEDPKESGHPNLMEEMEVDKDKAEAV